MKESVINELDDEQKSKISEIKDKLEVKVNIENEADDDHNYYYDHDHDHEYTHSHSHTHAVCRIWQHSSLDTIYPR